MNITRTEFEALQAKLDKARKQPANAPGCPPASFDGKEAELHQQIESWLKSKRFYYVHSRTDQRTTQAKGVVDFIVAMPGGKVAWVEIKRKGGKLSPEQVVVRHVLLALGHHYACVYSLAEFIEAVK